LREGLQRLKQVGDAPQAAREPRRHAVSQLAPGLVRNAGYRETAAIARRLESRWQGL